MRYNRYNRLDNDGCIRKMTSVAKGINVYYVELVTFGWLKLLHRMNALSVNRVNSGTSFKLGNKYEICMKVRLGDTGGKRRMNEPWRLPGETDLLQRKQASFGSKIQMHATKNHDAIHEKGIQRLLSVSIGENF